MRVVALLTVALLLAPATSYEDDIRAFRAKREGQIAGDEGWLTLARLVWLRGGDASIGSDPASAVVLPSAAPAHVGTITRNGRVVRFTARPATPPNAH